MADVKISALPAATTPLAGTEVLPIVQSSTTKKVAISDVTAGRAVSASSLTLTTPLGVASGGTGLTSLTAGYIPYGNGTGAFSSGSDLKYNGTVFNVGSTSSAWSGMGALQLFGGGAFATASSYARFGSNFYYDGSWKYVTSAEAARYEQAAGAHVFYTAASGTAGTAITFTQAMTLDASGRLSVATTATRSGYNLVVGTALSLDNTSRGVVSIVQSSNTDATRVGYLEWYGTNGTRYGYMGNGTGTIDLNLENSASFNVLSGNVGIGTSSPGTKLNVYTGSATATQIRAQNTNGYADFGPIGDGTIYGPYASPAASTSLLIGTSNSNPVLFYTNGSERARIDSSGALIVGSTSIPGTGKFAVYGGRTFFSANSETYSLSFGYSSARTSSGQTCYIGATDSATPSLVFSNAGGTERLRVNDDGSTTVCANVATPAAGSTAARLVFGTTAGFGIYYGSGAPTVSAAQGSIYLRSDGSSTSTRLYVNTNGSTTWTNVTTAA